MAKARGEDDKVPFAGGHRAAAGAELERVKAGVVSGPLSPGAGGTGDVVARNLNVIVNLL